MNEYTPWQVMDSLIRQGYSAQQANAMYNAMEGQRKSPEQLNAAYDAIGVKGAALPSGTDGAQDSGLTPNLTEAVAATAAIPAAEKLMPNKADQGRRNKLRAVGRFGGVGLAANLATMGGIALSGNDFYDKATLPQLGADIGGSIAGGFAGEALARSLTKKYGGKTGRDLINTPSGQAIVGAAKKPVAKALATGVGKTVAKSAIGRGAGLLAGRALGGTLGTALGPIGSIAGATLGGWLLPKLMSSGSKSVEDDDGKNHESDKADWGVLGGVTAAGAALAHPGTRKAIANKFKKKKPGESGFDFTHPFS